MDLTGLNDALRRDLEQLERLFEASAETLVPGVALAVTATVRGVPLVLTLDLDRYPGEPPVIIVADGWYWIHEDAHIGDDRQLVGLRTLSKWNRTLGLVAPLRELEVLFRERPPQQQFDPADAFRRFLGWLQGRVS